MSAPTFLRCFASRPPPKDHNNTDRPSFAIIFPDPPPIPSAPMSPERAIPASPSPPPPPLPAHPKHCWYEAGYTYDSSLSDREEDPAIEEQFVLRMSPGADCDYLHAAITNDHLSVDSEVWFRFKDERRAVVSVRGNLYSAILVDLPCILESNKTLDNKQFIKTADITQMLLVGDRITNEDQVMGISTRPSNICFPHGLTAPMRCIRQRRPQRRVPAKALEQIDAEVDRLLEEDALAESVEFSLEDDDGQYGDDITNNSGSNGDDDEYYYEEMVERGGPSGTTGKEEQDKSLVKNPSPASTPCPSPNKLLTVMIARAQAALCLLSSAGDEDEKDDDEMDASAPELEAALLALDDDDDDDEEEEEAGEDEEAARVAAAKKAASDHLDEEIREIEANLATTIAEHDKFGNALLRAGYCLVSTS